MSISTQGGEQHRPNVVKVGGKPGAKPGEKTPAGAKTPPKGPKGKPITPIKVNQGRNWGPIAMFTAVGVLAAGIIGYGAWQAFKPPFDWEGAAKAIPGIVDYRETNAADLTRTHAYGTQTYKQSPPVGGNHNEVWQQCMGNVYDAPIPNEHAVHALEHGAVWVAYRSDLPADQVAKLAAKVTGKEYMLMSPIEKLDKPISLQAWGFQLKLDSADDKRIDDFITDLRINATQEPGAVCSNGNTATGVTPLTQEQVQQMMQGANG
ncbi:DUF3105 domain-containing protein [Catellatospora sp. KI3]|uniref:DUF3105 domain-containing protein n=1 Tax=Catellatospora sp. KI3 TaxID=3041620 RepID=UPI0024827DE1|nr:DUF3105 domain-containing protein [Catellatospora sp. KI3]MDI1459709.1 DUF3105 domain-containing protein [Catellatospora sp. KI3]